MDEEELRILWTELARVPEIYREPLVLYYREHQSIEHVAAALDLSEDAVKQRLARGRRILQERVLAFVERALVRSTPGRAFTIRVIAAIPAMLPAPVKAAGFATAVAHGSTLVAPLPTASFCGAPPASRVLSRSAGPGRFARLGLPEPRHAFRGAAHPFPVFKP